MKVLVAAVAFVLGGCAFIDNKVALKYQSEPSQQPTAQSRGMVHVVPTKDSAGLARNAKGVLVIGHVRNSYGSKTADVLTDDSPSEWVHSALMDELRTRGFSPSSESASDTVVLTELVSIENETEVNFFTAADQVTTRLKVKVMRGGVVVEESECVGRSDHRAGVLSERTKQAAYIESLSKTVKAAADRVAEALSR